MIRITSEELVSFAREYCNITRYGKGMQCCALTKSVIADKAAQTHLKSWYASRDAKNKKIPKDMNNKQYLDSQVGIAKYGADCCGLIKGIGYGNRVNGPTTKYINADDDTIQTMANDCLNKKTDVRECEPGEFIWTKDFSHCAIVSVKGKKDIESAGSLDGVQEVDLTYQGGGKIIWAGGGELPWVDYPKKPEPTPAPTPTDEFKVGSRVTIAKGAVCGGLSSTRGKAVDPKYTGGWIGTISKLEAHKNVDEALIKEISTWIALKYLSIAEESSSGGNTPVPAPAPIPAPTPAPAPTPVEAKFKVGDKVKINPGSVYAGLSSTKGTPVPKSVCEKVLTISKIEKHNSQEEALLSEIVSWVATKDLTLVQASVAATVQKPLYSKKVRAGMLNVRKGPSTSYPVAYVTYYGRRVDVYEVKGQWSRIGDNEWVWSDYLM